MSVFNSAFCRLGWLLIFFPAMPSASADDVMATRNLREIFIGRCWDYRNVRYKNLLPDVSVSCVKLWKLFSRSFAYKDPCSVTMEDYEDYIAAAKQPITRDKAIFWEQVKDLVHDYTNYGTKYFALRDTLIGYISGDLFAESASGRVLVMLKGSDPDKPAYVADRLYPSSAFLVIRPFPSYELPNLALKKVTAVQVLLTYSPGGQHSEKCDTGSLVDLKNDVTDRGIVFSCIQDPKDVKHLQCAEDADNPECELKE
ncbi:hypothetical protein BaRGS_00026003 [Batillaria attramentaria]|uniref:ADP-ribosyl cyclase/cyclic ADP-ribose hydrolase n=1 Tax=Batillaria attramentaria TaxID=370345 RepID=A0ABD0K5P3_9CAEN